MSDLVIRWALEREGRGGGDKCRVCIYCVSFRAIKLSPVQLESCVYHVTELSVFQTERFSNIKAGVQC